MNEYLPTIEYEKNTPASLVPSMWLPVAPEEEIKFASGCAKALQKVIAGKSKKVIINGEQYLEFEDWQTLGRFFGYTVGTKWTKEIQRKNELFGFEAKAQVYDRAGVIISSAEAACLKDEPNWGNKPEFQLRSMAQTRAAVKALRNVLAWVAVLAGYKPTPAEEMINNQEPFPSNATNNPAIGAECFECGASIESQKVIDFSIKKFGKPYCFKCQKEIK